MIENNFIDARTNQLLPVEKRAISIEKQERLLLLMKTLAGFKVLRHKPMLKQRFVFLIHVLEGRVVHLPKTFCGEKISKFMSN